jgi:hypothetical protein
MLKVDVGNPMIIASVPVIAMSFVIPRNAQWMWVQVVGAVLAGRCRIEPVVSISRLWDERSRSGEYR